MKSLLIFTNTVSTKGNFDNTLYIREVNNNIYLCALMVLPGDQVNLVTVRLSNYMVRKVPTNKHPIMLI